MVEIGPKTPPRVEKIHTFYFFFKASLVNDSQIATITLFWLVYVLMYIISLITLGKILVVMW